MITARIHFPKSGETWLYLCDTVNDLKKYGVKGQVEYVEYTDEV